MGSRQELSSPSASSRLSPKSEAVLPGLTRTIARFLSAKAHSIALRAASGYRHSELRKDAQTNDEVSRILALLGIDEWSELGQEVSSSLQLVFADAGTGALEDLTVAEQTLVNALNQEAADYAASRGAELVGMKQLADGTFVVNPNAEFSIADTTREGLRDLIEKAFTEGLSPAQLAEEIRDSFLFSEARSAMIARTELAAAQVAGNVAAWKDSGVVAGKEWLTTEAPCPLCEPLNGEEVGLEESFSAGVDGPPLHPNCECTVLAVLKTEVAA